MEEKRKYNFKKDDKLRLLKILDREGNDKSNASNLYRERIGCIATDFQWDYYVSYKGRNRLFMRFVIDSNGMYINRKLHTSYVESVTGDSDGVIRLVTENSIYVFESATIREAEYLDDKNVIELFLDEANDYYLGRAYYFDSIGKRQLLDYHINLGMFQDSVLIFGTEGEIEGYTLCRFFPKEAGVLFYKTFCEDEIYTIPMLLHNTGASDLTIRVDWHSNTWTIKPGESKRIMPYLADDSDIEEKDNRDEG